MTTKKPRNALAKKKTRDTQKIIRTGFYIWAGLVTGAVIILSCLLFYFVRVHQQEDNSQIATLILQAAEGLNTPAPIDAKSGAVYLPQARLVLPMKQETIGESVAYRFSPALKDTPEELAIVNNLGFLIARTEMVGAQNYTDMFKAVPKLQACTRGYQLSFSPIAGNANPLKFDKKLADGRHLYVYIDKDCTQTSPDFDRYLNGIESYKY